MASIHLQSVVSKAAVLGVRAIGTESMDRMGVHGSSPATLLSLPCLPMAEPFPYGAPDNQGVLRTGRSARKAGVLPGASRAASVTRLAYWCRG